MQLLIAILLKSIIVSAIFFGYYLLLLRNRSMNRYNRLYLLISVIASIIIPFIHFEWYRINTTAATPMTRVFEIVNNNEQETQPTIHSHSLYTAEHAILATYMAVSLTLLLRAMSGIIKIYRLKAASKVDRLEHVNIIHTDTDGTPFSFMKNVFWNERTDVYSREGAQILKHEMVHVTQHHTYDKLLLQLVCAVYWINPVYWLMRKELGMVHEFLADGTSIEDGDAGTFATMLLQSHFGVAKYPIVNSFYSSPIKRRLTMLTNTSNTRFSRSRKLAALPLALAALGLFSFTIRKTAVTTANHKIVLMLDAGHGGLDDGGTNNSGLLEKDLALKLTTRLAEMAPEYNIAVLQTRSNDDYITLNKRAEAANNSNADVYVSVHINKSEAGSEASNDYVVYVSDANAQYTDSKLLAAQIANSLYTIGIKPEIANRKGLLVLRANKRPAVLVACGNIDDADDMARIKDPKRMDELCSTLLNGVVAYANNKK